MEKITFNRSFKKSETSYRTLCTQEEAGNCKTMADTIRLCKKNFPDATNGEISRFLSQGAKVGEEGHVRPQWIFNVLNNPPKGK